MNECNGTAAAAPSNASRPSEARHTVSGLWFVSVIHTESSNFPRFCELPTFFQNIFFLEQTQFPLLATEKFPTGRESGARSAYCKRDKEGNGAAP